MDFNKQVKSLSSNAQLLVMSVRDSDRAKFDAEKFDTTKFDTTKFDTTKFDTTKFDTTKFEIAQNKPFDLTSLPEKRGRGRPRKNPVENKPFATKKKSCRKQTI